MRTLKALLVGFVVTGTIQAQGAQPFANVEGWRTAKWGMTVEQVLSAFPKEAHRLDKPDDYDFTPTGGGKYLGQVGIDGFEIAGSVMKVRFLFSPDSGKLGYVMLSRFAHGDTVRNHQIDFDILEQQLTEKYGARTYADDKHDDGFGNAVLHLTRSWSLPKTVIDLSFDFEGKIYTNLSLAYHPKLANNKM